MRVKHLDELYSWKQIRKLQLVHDFNPHNGFIPVALYAPGEGHTSNYGDHYGWYGKRTAFCAKQLWEVVRNELADAERDALAFDIVEASECFNTIKFRDKAKAQSYLHSFKDLLRRYADSGKLKSAIGRAPARPYPWEPSKRYEEVIIDDDAEYKPFESHNSIPDYAECNFPNWDALEKYFIELTEDELAFLNGEAIINKKPSPLDLELVKACRELDVEKASVLLESGANPNTINTGPCYDTLVTTVLYAAYYREANDPKKRDAYGILELLISYGCDTDLCPYESDSPLCESIHFDISFTRFLLEKGANPNSISWIALEEAPITSLDHAADDISAYGGEEDLKMCFDLIEKAGGKFFSELVPDFYEV